MTHTGGTSGTAGTPGNLTDLPVAKLPADVGILGGGRMGAGIAHAFLCAGSAVSLAEAGEPASRAALKRVEDSLRASYERGQLQNTPDELLARLSVGVGAHHLAGCQLVVE